MDANLLTACRSGIYAIRCAPSGRVYVGSAVNIRNRWQHHRYDLARGKSNCTRLQSAWNKYGAEAFEFSVLEYVPALTDLIAREQHWMDTLSACCRRRGLNVNPTAGSSLGAQVSARTRDKQRTASTGRRHTPETRAKLSAFQKGKPATPAVLAVLSASRNGRVPSPETRAKLSAALKGRPLAAETRAKLCIARKGRTYTAETLAKMSASAKAKRTTLKPVPPSEPEVPVDTPKP